MIVTAIKTEKIHVKQPIEQILDVSLPVLREKMILVVTSKIVSICEGATNPISQINNKLEIIRNEADKWLTDSLSERYGVTITIKNNILISNAGIDESNGNGQYILWPSNPMGSAEQIWKYLRQKYLLHDIGVIITDSNIVPLRWGTRGVGIAWCGFRPLNDYVGKLDIYGRALKVTKSSILDGLAASAVTVMGEGDEQTPLATIADVPFVQFQQSPPTQTDINSLNISIEDDIYAPLLTRVSWNSNKS